MMGLCIHSRRRAVASNEHTGKDEIVLKLRLEILFQTGKAQPSPSDLFLK